MANTGFIVEEFTAEHEAALDACIEQSGTSEWIANFTKH